MIKNGISHTAIALLAVVSGEVLSDRFILYLPEIETIVTQHIWPIAQSHNLGLDATRLSTLVTIGIFAFLWGITFKIISQ